ncbi:hypothetical protein H1D32_08275 [Anaerobacillus sp. CMMVII]|uniref:hypothetical protein n=1 Tax=Anaerobacillus sp. CMMVII TaxID=2755588 RepID=UPI0021B7D494|nr:hypothetical protein [Anaerobacillus sp. CMMVII]MCT8137754.1 hypothetical protein [Anaerobacillus sp. CMMVII]
MQKPEQKPTRKKENPPANSNRDKKRNISVNKDKKESQSNNEKKIPKTNNGKNASVAETKVRATVLKTILTLIVIELKIKVRLIKSIKIKVTKGKKSERMYRRNL